MTPEFEKNNYMVIEKAIDPKIAEFVMNYFMMKRQVARTMFDERFISPSTTEWGVWNDSQMPETYSHYADIAMETLLIDVQPKMEKETGLDLIPTYAYARIYKNGDVLERHKDRFSCEISTTMNLGGDPWPIYIEPNPKKGKGGPNGYESEYTDGVEVVLKPGDMLVYKGNLCEHWRDKFDGTDCAQVFLHYNDAKTKGSKKNMFDGRPHLGLPWNWRENPVSPIVTDEQGNEIGVEEFNDSVDEVKTTGDIKVQDNFLEESQFQAIRDYVLDYDKQPIFNWFMSDVVRPQQNIGYTQWAHIVYGYGMVQSDFWNQIDGSGGLIEKLDPYTIVRIKLNLLTKHTEISESGMHIDVPYAPDVALTSILYMNTNNGYTKFETGEKVESVANRLVTFPNNMMHTGTTCTDEQYRCVMNIDYIKNQRTA